MDIVIVKTGIANIASLIAGFGRVGANASTSSDPQTIAKASHVVLPGVGAFAAGMKELHKQNLVTTLQDRINEDKATLAVCLGLHLLCNDSEESPDVSGLGIIDASVKRFTTGKVPQLGWNQVLPSKECSLVSEGYAYFANSYHLPEDISGWSTAKTEYGDTFVSAIERRNILGCQFHPELSGTWGLELLKRWLNRTEATC